MVVWEKYNKLEEYDNKTTEDFKTYHVQKEYIIKELPYQNDDDKLFILGKIEIMKNELEIYDIIEEESCIYVVIDYENEKVNKFDNLYKNNNNYFHFENTLKGQGKYSNFSEIKNLYKKGENKIVKISSINNGKKVNGTGFFLELNSNLELPFNKALLTNNHVLNEDYLFNKNDIDLKLNNKSICLDISDSQIFTIQKYNRKEKNLKRKIFTDPFLDFTCIELFDEDFGEDNDFDGQFELFKIKEKIDEIKNKDIFVLQYPCDEDLSFSLGKILGEKDFNFAHNASTYKGSSGSPILIRDLSNIIGMHKGGDNTNNIGIFIKDILLHIKSINSNIDIITKEIDKLKDKISISFNNKKYLKKSPPILEGDIGSIFEGINKKKENLLIIEINLIKLYKNSGMNFLNTIKKKIKLIKNENKSEDLDIFLEGNNLNIAIYKYEERFIDYFKNNKYELSNNEIYALIQQLEQDMKKKSKEKIQNFSPESIIIENKKAMKYRFIYCYNLIIGVKNNNSLYINPYSSSKNDEKWILGIFLYYLTMKGKYPFNYTNSKDIIKSIENGKEMTLNKNNIFSSNIINLIYKDFNDQSYKLEFQQQNQRLRFLKNYKINFCLNKEVSICFFHIYDPLNKKENIFNTLNFGAIKSIPFKRVLMSYDILDYIYSTIKGYAKDNKINEIKENTLKLNNTKISIKNHCLFIQLLENNNNIDNFIEIDEIDEKETIYENNDIILLPYAIKESDFNNKFSFSKGKIIKNNENEKSEILFKIPGAITLEGYNMEHIGINVGFNQKLKRNIFLYITVFLDPKQFDLKDMLIKQCLKFLKMNLLQINNEYSKKIYKK